MDKENAPVRMKLKIELDTPSKEVFRLRQRKLTFELCTMALCSGITLHSLYIRCSSIWIQLWIHLSYIQLPRQRNFTRASMAYRQPRLPVRASSVYSVPACEAIDTLRRVRDVNACGASSAVHMHAAERRLALQMLTGIDKVLCSDGVFRNPDSGRPIGIQPAPSSEVEYAPIHYQTSAVADLGKPVGRCANRTPMKIITRHGTVRSARSWRPEKYSDFLTTEAMSNPQGHQTSLPISAYEGQSKPVRFPNLTREKLFPPIMASERRFVPTATNGGPPTRRPSLVRKLSDSVKGIFCRRSSINRHGISRPSDFQESRSGPQHKDNKRPEDHADPLNVAQAGSHPARSQSRNDHSIATLDDSAGSKQNYQKQMPLWNFSLNKTRLATNQDSQSDSSRNSAGKPLRRKQASESLHDAQKGPFNATVVGDATRGTVFGDFIEAKEAHATTNKQLPPLPPLPLLSQYSRPDLAPEPLRVPSTKSDNGAARNRSLRKRVDPTTRSWMPPEPGSNHRKFKSADETPKMSSKQDPSVYRLMYNNPFDPVEDIIDIYADEEEPASRERENGNSNRGHHSQQRRDSAREEPFVDTFDRGSHLSWVAFQRRTSTHNGRPSFGGENENLYDQCMRQLADVGPRRFGEERFGYI